VLLHVELCKSVLHASLDIVSKNLTIVTVVKHTTIYSSLALNLLIC